MHRCRCESCQIMDRNIERVCCQEVLEVANKNAEVYDKLHPPAPYQCITDNPGFQAVCLNPWILQVAWYQYKQMLLKDQNTRLIDMWPTDN